MSITNNRQFHHSLMEARNMLMAIPLQRIALLRRRRASRSNSGAAYQSASRSKKTSEALVGQTLTRATSVVLSVPYPLSGVGESEGDYMGYIRMSRDIFAELLLRVTPRISKSNRQVYTILLPSRILQLQKLLFHCAAGYGRCGL